ncbi:S8 family serine peptidase [Pseudoalteromonas sp. ACER1]|uniref:S8 family serine peptidase n=1 Tax=unclassified Pseudoalteromonas TaxID=194690 RepID=UPI001F3675C1|nr:MULTISPECIES: S8 family serine peptidase [unclassified Pseudoalteromonas]MCF2848919.1 S8 family serine peptidase [Pseudoalteromonas sp. PAST1]MCO7212354.1 S8 family serine peptidase [Pseudoalteromonas sp. ACER1]
MKHPRNFALTLIATSLLAACGSDNDSNDEKQNIAPVISAESQVSFDELTTLTLEPEVMDSDGTISSYQWAQLSGPEMDLSNTTDATFSITAPEVDEDTTVEIELTATDNQGASTKHTTTLTIKNVLIAPVIDAKDPQEINENTAATLNLEASDPNGEIISYAWSQVSGVEVEIADSSTTNLEFTAPDVDFDEELQFELLVTDNDGQTFTQTLDVIVVNVPTDALGSPKGLETIEVNGRSVEAAQDELLVHLKEDITLEEQQAVLDKIDSLGGSLNSYDKKLKLMQVRVRDTAEESVLINDLANLEGVRHSGLNEIVVPDSLRENPIKFKKPKSNKSMQLTMAKKVASVEDEATYTGDYWHSIIAADKAWQAIEEDSLESVKVGVVDTGISDTQTSLDESRLSRLQILADGGYVTTDTDDTDSEHGLWVTSFVAAHNMTEGKSYSGVNPYANVIHADVYFRRCDGILSAADCPFGIGEKTFVTDLIAGAKATIDNGASIVNLSWGDTSKCSDPTEVRLQSRRSWRLNQTNLVEYAKSKDALLIYSAGNNCEKADHQLLLSEDDIGADAWKTNALIVAATDSSNMDATFSRMGEVVNIAAPGVDLGWGNGEVGSGTSYAAPLVTGSAGLIKGINSSLKAAEVRDILLSTASNTVVLSDESKDVGTTTPTKLLNLNSAVKTAQLTVDSDLEVMAATSLSKGSEINKTIEFSLPETTVNALDIMFLIDVSGSYDDDISNLKTQADAILDNLTGRGINVAFGVSAFSDFPIDGYGSAGSGDEAFYLLQEVTTNVDDVKSGITSLETFYGGDYQESQLEGLYQVATGAGRDINDDGQYTDAGEISPSSIGWREGALKVVLLATDAAFHDSDLETDYPGAGFTQVISELQDNGITVFGLQSGSNSDTTEDINRVVSATGGVSFMLSTDSNEIADRISEALDEALKEIDISIEHISGEEWVANITPEVIQAAKPGDTVTFDVTLQGVKSASIEPLNYEVILWVRGDESAVLRRVVLPITVPVAE